MMLLCHLTRCKDLAATQPYLSAIADCELLVVVQCQYAVGESVGWLFNFHSHIGTFYDDLTECYFPSSTGRWL